MPSGVIPISLKVSTNATYRYIRVTWCITWCNHLYKTSITPKTVLLSPKYQWVKYLNCSNANERVDSVFKCSFFCGHDQIVEIDAMGRQHSVWSQNGVSEDIEHHHVPSHPVPLGPHSREDKPSGSPLSIVRLHEITYTVIMAFTGYKNKSLLRWLSENCFIHGIP